MSQGHTTPGVEAPIRSLIPMDVLEAVQHQAAEIVATPEELAHGELATVPLSLAGDPRRSHRRLVDRLTVVESLRQVPLFATIPEESLQALAVDAALVDVAKGDLLFSEGDDARSFFVLLDGALEILRQRDDHEVSIRNVKAGEVFGLFGLFSTQLRSASSKAVDRATVLEINGETLQELLEEDEAVHHKLLSYYRDRSIESFMSSRFFADIDPIARNRFIGRFNVMTFDAGQLLVNPGEVTNLMAIVTHGRCILESRNQVGQSAQRLEVTQGQFMIVAGAMVGSPARYKIYAADDSSLCVLAHRDLAELIRDDPAINTLPSRFSQFTRQIDRGLYCGTVGIPGL